MAKRSLLAPLLGRQGRRVALSAAGSKLPGMEAEASGADRSFSLLSLGSPTQPQVIAVCSALGSVGKSTLAAGLAEAIAESLGKRGARGTAMRATCLLDLDTFSPSQAVMHARTEITAGVLGSARLIRQERYSDGEHERLVARAGAYDLLTGIASLDRWPELDEYSVGLLLHDQVGRYDQLVLDLGGNPTATEVDPELGLRRNQATVKALTAADVAIVVTAADPVSLSRTLNLLASLQNLVAGRLMVAVNRWRTTAIGGGAQSQVLDLLAKAGIAVDQVLFVPEDAGNCDSALSRGVSVVHAKPRGPIARAMRDLVTQINSSHVHSSRAGQAERQG